MSGFVRNEIGWNRIVLEGLHLFLRLVWLHEGVATGWAELVEGIQGPTLVVEPIYMSICLSVVVKLQRVWWQAVRITI